MMIRIYNNPFSDGHQVQLGPNLPDSYQLLPRVDCPRLFFADFDCGHCSGCNYKNPPSPPRRQLSPPPSTSHPPNSHKQSNQTRRSASFTTNNSFNLFKLFDPPIATSTMAPPRHHKQQQSLLFSKLPVDIRRHIYKQYWQIYGSTQHVFLFGNDSYLSHFPCLLEGKEFKQHCNPTPPKEDQPATDQAAADQPATNQPATNQPAADNDGDQPESHDEPGNINAAIQDILNNPPETPAGPAENGDDAAQLIDAVLSDESFTMEEILDDWEVIHSTNNDQPESHDDPGNVNAAIQDMINLEILHGGPGKWIKSPWCEHVHCVSAYVSTFDSIFELAYSRHFKRARRHPGHPLPTVGMTKPFHVCKRMYIEASESLFSNVRFSFDDLRALERFTKQLSPETANMVRSVEVCHQINPVFPSLQFVVLSHAC